ncbi:hypothetical protein FQA39_LY05528 [Lamprigera yunnana]|nr:hypothetical protein FQA39_LY05528 [Lamprigera yunnana]
MESRGSRHTLVIRKVHRSDFGNYTCVADNQLGKTRKSVQLTGLKIFLIGKSNEPEILGKPNPAKFNSAARGQWRDSYNITWAVESLSPIEEFKLLYRRLPDVSGTSEDGHPRPLQHLASKKENKTFASTGYYNMGYGRQYIDRRSDWRDVILPAMATQAPGLQTMSYVIRALEPAQIYEAKVQSRNKYGWSPISEAFTFQTTDSENEVRDLGIRMYSSSNNWKAIDILFLVICTTLHTLT